MCEDTLEPFILTYCTIRRDVGQANNDALLDIDRLLLGVGASIGTGEGDH